MDEWAMLADFVEGIVGCHAGADEIGGGHCGCAPDTNATMDVDFAVVCDVLVDEVHALA